MSDPSQPLNSSFFHGAQNFSMTNVQFTEIHNHPAPVQSPLPPLPPLKHSSPFFVGRDEYLQRMKDYFGSHGEGERRSFLLYGLGGIGKTQISLRFLEQNAGLFSDIHWLDAKSEATIELGLMQIAQAKNAPKEVMHSSGFVLQWISQMPKWLIIYDNADGHYSVVEKFLPPGGGGNILITSRNWELERLVLGSVNVLAMEEEEAVTLFLKSAMLDGTCDHVRNGAKKMVLELSGIPLALDQAGAYIHRSGCGIDGYLQLYQKSKDKLMSKKEFQGASGYGRSAYGTWDISFQQIEQMALNENGEEAEAAQNAISLLRIFAFLNHENIPEELFQNAAENYTLFIDEHGEWDRMPFLDGIQVLLSFSIISVVNHVYSMHLLVSSWSRSHMSQTEISNWYHRARALLSCSVVPDWNLDNHAFCKLLAPHIRSNLLYGQELRLQEKYYGHEYNSFLIVFDRIGSWGEEEKLLNAAVNESKAMFGTDHPNIYTAMYNLASIYQRQARWNEAEKLQVEVMKAREAKLGSDHPGTLATMSNLALTYQYQERLVEAEKLQVDVIKKQKVMLGSDHTDTLTTMNNLASTYQKQGRWDEAEKLRVEVIKTWKMKLGLDHPNTLTTMNNLATTYQKQGRWDEAEKLQAEVMKAQKAKLGSDHLGTLTIMNNLALTYYKQGRCDEAEKLQVEVIKAWKIKLGSDHPGTLTAMSNLASTYQYQGRHDEAEKLLVEVMYARKVKLGPEHPDTLQAMASLALIHLSQDSMLW
ncbi:P-loop containing nucleoside triphosphate hydrolase protein [Amanita rubescens]|nr:P-loop containing nucleoside triphosphate hydrolase protein [Amanita rubescens]